MPIVKVETEEFLSDAREQLEVYSRFLNNQKLHPEIMSVAARYFRLKFLVEQLEKGIEGGVL